MTQMPLGEIHICSENHDHNDEAYQYQNIKNPRKNQSKKSEKQRDPNGENDTQLNLDTPSEDTISQYEREIPTA